MDAANVDLSEDKKTRTAKFFAQARDAASRGDLDGYASAVDAAFRLRPFMLHPLPRGPQTYTKASLEHMRKRALALIERRVAYSPMILSVAFAEAKLGNRGEVERLVDYERFFSVQRSIVPEFPDFFDAISAEIKTKLHYFGEPKTAERTIHNAFRHENVFQTERPAIQALRQEVRRRVEAYIAELPKDAQHPFVTSCPDDYVIEAWAVVSQDEGYHDIHIHPRAWLSGVYYIKRPDVSTDPKVKAGWLKVGAPPTIDEGDGWGERNIEPIPGTLVLMPGYFLHSSIPSQSAQERICIAFDVVPKRVAETV
ncbi:MAG TPA: putative 2OG-Fe(II) oxygenase [Rhizomicrobium sp.]|nr:putative 2OG-Fe(II) oxygenase [Rhizomicrobium sp.]